MIFHYYHSTDSTNTQAKRLLDQGLNRDMVLIAREQRTGRGRMGRAFYSPLGGIYMSLVLTGVPGPALSLVTPAAAVAVASAIGQTTALACRIKWVNDIYLNDKKVCGILTELYKGTVIIGIGVNHIAPEQGFLPELEASVTSLFPWGQAGCRQRLIGQIVQEVIDLVGQLPDPAFLSRYRAWSNVLGRAVTVYQGERCFSAVAEAIDEQGHLICRRADGEQVILTAGEVSIRAEGDVPRSVINGGSGTSCNNPG